MQELLQLYAPRKSLRDEHTLPVVDFAMPLAVENANSPVRFRIRQGLPSFVVFRFRRGKISDFRIADGIAARNIYGNEMQRFRTFEPPGHLARKTHFEAVAPPPGAGLSQIVHRRIRAVFLIQAAAESCLCAPARCIVANRLKNNSPIMIVKCFMATGCNSE